jgi:hemolysin activation/secretion protein
MIRILSLLLLVIFLCTVTYASQMPTGQGVGSSFRKYIEDDERKERTDRLASLKEKTPPLDAPEIESLPSDSPSIYIRKIVIQRGVLFSEEKINERLLKSIIRDYKRRKLTLDGMRQFAERISREILPVGTKAYIPDQSFSKGIMYVNLRK